MSGFELDTSGFVEGRPEGIRTRRFWWRDLTPFAQGYVEAMLQDAPSCGALTDIRWPAFSDLAPETLAGIIRDCANFENFASSLGFKTGPIEGRRFWNGRASKSLTGAWAAAFPALTPHLGGDGRIYLRATET